MRTMIVGECWKGTALRGVFTSSWDVKTALTLGAYSGGNSNKLLISTGFKWGVSANLCPPSQWSTPVARRIANALLAHEKPDIVLVFGQRACHAFDIRVVWLQKQMIGDTTVFALPCPARATTLWNLPEFQEKLRAFTSGLRSVA